MALPHLFGSYATAGLAYHAVRIPGSTSVSRLNRETLLRHGGYSHSLLGSLENHVQVRFGAPCAAKVWEGPE